MTKKKVKYLDKNNKEISQEKFEETFLKKTVIRDGEGKEIAVIKIY